MQCAGIDSSSCTLSAWNQLRDNGLTVPRAVVQGASIADAGEIVAVVEQLAQPDVTQPVCQAKGIAKGLEPDAESLHSQLASNVYYVNS